MMTLAEPCWAMSETFQLVQQYFYSLFITLATRVERYIALIRLILYEHNGKYLLISVSTLIPL